jgi:acetyl esterase/lipase
MKRWIIGVVVVVLGGVLTPGVQAQSAPTPAGVEVLRDVEYAKVGETSLKLDLYLPKRGEGEPKPGLIVWIHGGGWAGGNKSGNPMAWLTGHGYAMASIAYRFSDVAKFPAQVHDCKGAIRWLRANADKHGFDATRIGVSGASAGGHLAALLGTSGDVKELEGDVGGNLDHSSRVQAVVDYCGPTDFELFAQTADWINRPNSLVANLLGGVVAEQTQQARAASPAHHVGEGDAPLFAIHGDRDPLVPVTQAVRLHERYQAAGLKSSLDVIPGVGHVGAEFWDARRRGLIERFFEESLKGEGK